MLWGLKEVCYFIYWIHREVTAEVNRSKKQAASNEINTQVETNGSEGQAETLTEPNKGAESNVENSTNEEAKGGSEASNKAETKIE
ncbi:hypothetical protein TrRE_jg11613, partial [Triparma retinervis]